VRASAVMDMHFGNSNKNVAAVFSLAAKLQPCIVFVGAQQSVWTPPASLGERMLGLDMLRRRVDYSNADVQALKGGTTAVHPAVMRTLLRGAQTRRTRCSACGA